MHLKKETLMNVAEHGKKEELEIVLESTSQRCDLPIEFYIHCIKKTKPQNSHNNWFMGSVIAELLFEVSSSGKIPIMEFLKNDDPEKIAWVLEELDQCLGNIKVLVTYPPNVYDKEDYILLFRLSKRLLRCQIVRTFCLFSSDSDVTSRLIKEYYFHYGHDITPELSIWICQSKPLTLECFTKLPYLDEDLASYAVSCEDCDISLLEKWVISDDCYERMAVAYYAQAHRTFKTKALVRKLLTDDRIEVRREALVAFAGFSNVSKKRIIKELYRPKNDKLRVSNELLARCELRDDILVYLVSLPRSKYHKVAMAYVDEIEYYGKINSTIVNDILQMLDGEEIRCQFFKKLFKRIDGLGIWMLCYEKNISSVPKTLYIRCLGNVVAAVRLTVGNGYAPCFEVIDIIGDFYGEKIAIPTDQEINTLEVGDVHLIRTYGLMLAPILAYNIF